MKHEVTDHNYIRNTEHNLIGVNLISGRNMHNKYNNFMIETLDYHVPILTQVAKIS